MIKIYCVKFFKNLFRLLFLCVCKHACEYGDCTYVFAGVCTCDEYQVHQNEKQFHK